MNAQTWLDHPGIMALLHLLVDRLDRAEIESKPLVRAIKLNASTFPELYKAKYEAERAELWQYVERIVKLGWIALKLDRGGPGQVGYELNPRITIENASALRTQVGRTVRTLTYTELWKVAVAERCNQESHVSAMLARYPIEIDGRHAKEIVDRLMSIKPLINEPLLLRELSARLFWGNSKILDNKAKLVATLLGMESCPFPDMPIQLHVHIPKDGFTGVLFIENLATYEQSIRSLDPKFNNLALVFCSGFKGTAKRLRTQTGGTVYFTELSTHETALRQQFIHWLRSDQFLPTWFWGDLDHSGMEILSNLRQSFTSARAWEPGYTPMMQLLISGHGHSPAEAGKEYQRIATNTGCPFADNELIPTLLQYRRYVDQEIL